MRRLFKCLSRMAGNIAAARNMRPYPGMKIVETDKYYYNEDKKGVVDLQAGVRNRLVGTVIEIKQGDVMSEVITRVGDNEITSVMTTDSLREVGFKVGDTVTSLIKAINVVMVK